MPRPPRPDPRFLLEPFEPVSVRLLREGVLPARVERARRALASCRACPRACEVNRLEDETGTCHTGREAVVSSAFPHLGEEACLRGWRGSGTIFFAHCNLKCVFCQNWDISHEGRGKALSAEAIASLMLELQGIGCHNVNLVTPEHVVPQVVEAIVLAVGRGLRLPIVYNTSAYDALDSLALLDGLIDVYMPDFKFWDPETAHRLAKARDYPEAARAAIQAMHRQVGDLRFAGDGTARRGVLVRHLVMPGQLDQARAIFRWLATAVSPDTFVNVMGQYRPEHLVGRAHADGTSRFGAINRRPSGAAVRDARAAAREAGLWRFDERD